MKKWFSGTKSEKGPGKKLPEPDKCADTQWLSLFDRFPDFVLQVNSDNKILYMNRTINGIPVNQLTGQNVLGQISLFNSAVLNEPLLKAFREGKESVLEAQGDEINIHYLIRIIPQVNDEITESVFLFISDFRTQRQSESDFVGLTNLGKAKDELKHRIITTISPEIRNPMHVILSYVNFLSESSLNPEQKQALEIVAKSSRNLFFVLDEIQDYLKIVTGQFSLKSLDFNLDELVKQVVDHYKPIAEAKKLQLEIHNFHLLNGSLTGDKERLHQLMLHLVGNAIKFTEKGQVDVTLKLIKQNGSILDFQIVIADTGIGIEAQNLEKVFESFAKEDESISRQHNGLGLGLTISRYIVGLMKGKLELTSKKGDGSIVTISLSLPISNNAVPRLSTVDYLINTEDFDATIRKIKVLLVEDDVQQQNIAIKVLKGWNVTVAENGLAAIQLLEKKNDFDLIMMDISMPVMGGIEATKRIRTDLKLNIPVVAVSGEAFVESTIKECVEAGINDFVPKPYDKATLVENLLNNLKDKELALAKHNTEYPSQLLAGRKVLYVEDNEINQKVTRRMLEKLGCEIEIAKDGITAFQLIHSSHFDFYLLDLILPDMSGFEVSKRIREMGIIAPVIAYSGDDGIDTEKKCIDTGMDGVMLKPQKDFLEMGLKIHEIIDKSKNKKLYNFDFLINKMYSEDEIPDLVNDFLESTTSLIFKLSKSVEQNDMKMLKQTAHTLKTSFLNFGIQSVRTSLILLEDYASKFLSNDLIVENPEAEAGKEKKEQSMNLETSQLLINNVTKVFEEVRRQFKSDFKLDNYVKNN